MLKRKRVLVLGYVLTLAVAITAWLLIHRQSDVGRRVFGQDPYTIEKLIREGTIGPDGLVQALRAEEADSFNYISNKVYQQDSWMRKLYIAAWPKLPGRLKYRLESNGPQTAVQINRLAIKTIRFWAYSTNIAALTTLAGALNHHDHEVRAIAGQALCLMGPGAKSTVPIIINLLQSRLRTNTGNEDINGIVALGQVGPDANASIPMLESVIRTKRGRARVFAAEALWKVGGDRSTAIAALEESLGDDDAAARREAAEKLGEARSKTTRSSSNDSP